MRLRPVPLAAIPLAVVAIALACDSPVSPPADAPAATAPASTAANVPTAAAPPSRSSLELVGPAAHSVLGLQEHLDLHVEQAREIEEDSDARVLEAFREAGASEEQLERWRLAQEESRNRDSEHLRELLTAVLTR